MRNRSPPDARDLRFLSPFLSPRHFFPRIVHLPYSKSSRGAKHGFAEDILNRRGIAVTEQKPTPTFEQAVKRLEEIAQALDDQALSLDTALALFEEGILASRQCAQHLETARLRVEKLVEQAPGVFSLQVFDQETPISAASSQDDE